MDSRLHKSLFVDFNMSICRFSISIMAVLHSFHLMSSVIMVKVSPSSKAIDFFFCLLPVSTHCPLRFQDTLLLFHHPVYWERMTRVRIRRWSAGQLQTIINFFDLLVLSLYNEIPLAWKKSIVYLSGSWMFPGY